MQNVKFFILFNLKSNQMYILFVLDVIEYMCLTQYVSLLI